MRALIAVYVFLSLSLIAYGAGADFLKADVEDDIASLPQARFELYTGKDGEHWWRLKDANNQVIASGEGFADNDSALAAIRAVQKYSANARIDEFEAK